MSEPTMIELRAAAAAVVLATPGVDRVEPSLRSALRRLTGPGQLVAVGSVAPGEGVHVSRRDRAVAISTDVVLDGSRPVLVVADELQLALEAFVLEQGFVPSRIRVHVLGIDETPLAAPLAG